MLSRKRARVAIIVICIGILISCLSFLFWQKWMFYTGVLVLLCGMWIPDVRCPNCKRFFVTGTWEIKFHWDKPTEGNCPKCGKLLLYDDQPSADAGCIDE